MIKRLTIANFVIIDKLTVEFGEGLTVVTGETGAGKSILLDAMGLILGDEPDREAIRQGTDESSFEAVFWPPQGHPVWEFLAKHEGLQSNTTDIQIRRVFDRNQKDEIVVNGVMVALPFLKELGVYLVEIHGQFANQNFLSPESQLNLLDAFGNYPPGILENVAKAWDDIGRLTKELEDEQKFLAVAEREKTGIQRLVAKVEKLGLKKGLVEDLKAQLAYLCNRRDIRELFQTINAQLVAQSGAELSLARVDRLLAGQKDPVLDKMKECVKIAYEKTHEAAQEMQALAPKYLDIDTSKIQTLEKQLGDIKAISDECKIVPEKMFDHYEMLSKRLARIIAAPTKIRELNDQLIKAREFYRHHAHILTEEREKAAERLSDAITSEMAPLKLLSAQAKIEVTEDTNKPTARGINEIIFTARMNPGMPFSPIAETASGGELARLILAIKMILQQVQSVSTLVFDEIDTGIGGAAAAAVGGRIAKLAASTQILVITHSPQVASRGKQHFHVSKRIDGNSTRTFVDLLSYEKRVEEVSRMLAGEVPTDQSMAAAKTLLEEAFKAGG